MYKFILKQIYPQNLPDFFHLSGRNTAIYYSR